MRRLPILPQNFTFPKLQSIECANDIRAKASISNRKDPVIQKLSMTIPIGTRGNCHFARINDSRLTGIIFSKVKKNVKYPFSVRSSSGLFLTCCTIGLVFVFLDFYGIISAIIILGRCCLWSLISV